MLRKVFQAIVGIGVEVMVILVFTLLCLGISWLFVQRAASGV